MTEIDQSIIEMYKYLGNINSFIRKRFNYLLKGKIYINICYLEYLIKFLLFL